MNVELWAGVRVEGRWTGRERGGARGWTASVRCTAEVGVGVVGDHVSAGADEVQDAGAGDSPSAVGGVREGAGREGGARPAASPALCDELWEASLAPPHRCDAPPRHLRDGDGVERGGVGVEGGGKREVRGEGAIVLAAVAARRWRGRRRRRSRDERRRGKRSGGKEVGKSEGRGEGDRRGCGVEVVEEEEEEEEEEHIRFDDGGGCGEGSKLEEEGRGGGRGRASKRAVMTRKAEVTVVSGDGFHHVMQVTPLPPARSAETFL